MLRNSKFFRRQSVKVSGGIMASVAALPATASTGSATPIPLTGKFRKIVRTTASLFDEIIFDDLFIFNCQCDLCQKAKET